MNRTSYNNVSTADLEDRRNNVEMLWLDAVEHKLQKELAELQDTTIDKNCIGCWQKLDECRKLESIRVQCDTELIDKLHMEIHNQNKTIDELNERYTRLAAVKDVLYYRSEEQQNTIDEYRETVENRDKTIERRGDAIKRQLRTIEGLEAELKDKDKAIGKCLRRIDDHLQDKARMQQRINGLEYDLRICKGSGTAQDIYIAGLRKVIKDLKDNQLEDLKELSIYDQHEIEGLEAELSARKGDSEVLMKVVDVIRRWGDERIPSRSAMNQIAYVTKDYLNAPESPIEEEHGITAKMAFLEMP